jgi:hypothetical protein
MTEATKGISLDRFDDGSYVSHCWNCGHGYHAERVITFTRCRCCQNTEKKALKGGRALPNGLCPLDVAD